MVTVWLSAAGLIHYTFLNPSKTISSEKYAQQIDEMHWKPQSLQPALVNRKGSILLHNNARLHITQPTLQKLNELGYKVLPHLSFTWSPANRLPLCQASWQLFAGKILPQSARGNSLLNPKTWIFMLQKETNLFLIGKNVLIVIVHILIDKDVFESIIMI